MKPEPATKATFITFYSFKGGVGRSMALINTAGILAGRRGFRVLVLDLDLEAPGLTYLDPESPDVVPTGAQRELPLQPGFVDLLTDALERGEAADLFKLSDADLEAKYTRTIKLPDPLREFPDGSLRIMPSGRRDHDYSQRLDALNLNALYREGLGEPLIRAFKKRFAESGRYDYVLVDSRTGISEGAGICTRDLADHVMVLSGLNRQNVEGTSDFLREFRAATDGKKNVQIILSPIPNGEDELLERRREAAEQRFAEAWGAKVDLSLEIPYHPQLALTEEPHIFRRSRGYLFEAYRRIEVSMLDGLGHDAQTFRQRIMQSLEEKRYEEALRDLYHMIRLDRGRGALSRLVDDLTTGRRPRRSAEAEPLQEQVTFERLLNDEGGCRVAEFIVDKLSLGERDWQTRRLLQELDQYSADLSEKLVKRIFEAVADNADTLGGYAAYFAREGKSDAAATFYKRAIEANPNHANNLGNYALFLWKREQFEKADAFYNLAIQADPNHANNLGNYAIFLKNRERFEEAEAFYKRAIEADPNHANNLGNYANFLENRERFEEAEAFYKRAIEADPKHARNLGNHAIFLENRERFEEAESSYKRAIEASSKQANSLNSYALFLSRRERFEEAEASYKRAIETDPEDASSLGNYAIFLERRERFEEAEAFYKRASEADPERANNLGNYGQFLVGGGQFPEGEDKLLQAFEHINRSVRGGTAEVCFSLWLVVRMQGRDAAEWERRFKFLIEEGFKRHPWSFERMLQQAEKRLSTEELEYARAMAAAFLDESNVTNLAKYPRWKALEALAPKPQPAESVS
jgi:tetratricopeptide (TPR) repeat protein